MGKPTKKETERKKTWIALFFFAFLIIIIFWFTRQELAELLIFIADRDAFRVYIYGYGIWGPAVIGIFQVIQTIIALIPAHPVVMAAGYIYGIPLGFLINWIPITGAGMLAFWIGRWGGRPVVIRVAPAKIIDRWDGVAKEHGFAFFLSAFLLPVFPGDTMNYVAGISSISAKKFFFAKAIGISPAILLQTMVGAYGLEVASLNIPIWGWVVIGISFTALAAIWQYAFHFKIKDDLLP